jgi:hypothetical protein
MSAVTKKPGFDNSVGNRNRRVNRFAGNLNKMDRRHKEARGTTIGYDTVPTPDEITDSGNDLAKFAVDEVVESEGSTSNDGRDVVQTVAAGALGVDDAVTLEAASADIRVRSLNNQRDSRFS